MPTTSITCPECDAVLKVAATVPAGKKIKCPKCNTVFPVPGEEEDGNGNGAAIQTAPRLRKPLRQADMDDEPEDEEEDAPPARKPARKSRPVAEEDDEPEEEFDEEEDDDRPRRKSSGKRKKGKKLSGLKLGLIIGGVSFLVVGGAITAVVLFFMSGGRNKGTGNEDPLAYLPADSSAIMGADVGGLMNQPTIATQIEQALTKQGRNDFFTRLKKETGLETKDLFDHVAVGLKGSAAQGFNNGQGTLILKTRVPFDQKKVPKAAKDAEKKTAQGKIYYRINEADFRVLFMPSDRIIVLSSLSEGELEPIFKSDGTKLQINADAADLVRKASSSLGWMVMSIDPAMKQQLNAGMAMAAGAGPEVKNAVQQAKAFGIWGTLEGTQVKLNVSVTLGDAGTAKAAATNAQTEWNNATKGLGAAQLKLGLALLPAGLKDFINEVIQTLKFGSDGAMLQMTAQASLQSVEKFIKEAQNQAAGMAVPPGGAPRPFGPGIPQGGIPQGGRRPGGP